MKILIVDDEEDIRQIARFALSQVGCMKVLEAENGRRGRTDRGEEKPDAILMDVFMPGLDGPATLVNCVKNPGTSTIPVIFLTAQSSPSELNKLKSFGAAGILNKPFDPITLADEVEAVLKGR